MNTPIWALFLLYHGTGTTYIFLAMLLSTLIESKHLAFMLSFTIVVMSMVICLALSEPTIMKKIFFNLDMPIWVRVFSSAFWLAPSFQFGKIYGDIANVVLAKFDPKSLTWENQD